MAWLIDLSQTRVNPGYIDEVIRTGFKNHLGQGDSSLFILDISDTNQMAQAIAQKGMP